MEINAKFGLRGEFKCVVFDKDGNKRLETDWFDNHITDYGLEHFFYSNHAQYYSIGQSSQTPVDGDTQLIAFYKGSSTATGTANTHGSEGASDYEFWMVSGRRFSITDTVTIREFGVGSASNGTNLVSRSILSSGISMTDGEVLDVYWKLWVYPNNPLREDTSNMTIDGISYSVTQGWSAIASIYGDINTAFAPQWATSTGCRGYDSQTLNIPTGNPSGSFGNTDGNGSYPTSLGVVGNTLSWKYSVGLNTWNYTNGLGAIAAWTNHGPGVQANFVSNVDSDPIPKVNTKVMEVFISLTLGRYTP